MDDHLLHVALPAPPRGWVSSPAGSPFYPLSRSHIRATIARGEAACRRQTIRRVIIAAGARAHLADPRSMEIRGLA